MAGVRFLIAGSILYAFTARAPPGRPAEWLWAAASGVLLALGNGGVTWGAADRSVGHRGLADRDRPALDRPPGPGLSGGRRLGLRAGVGIASGSSGSRSSSGRAASGEADVAGVVAPSSRPSHGRPGPFSRAARRSRRDRSAPRACRCSRAASRCSSAAWRPGRLARFGSRTRRSSRGSRFVYLVFIGGILAFTCYQWLLRTRGRRSSRRTPT